MGIAFEVGSGVALGKLISEEEEPMTMTVLDEPDCRPTTVVDEPVPIVIEEPGVSVWPDTIYCEAESVLRVALPITIGAKDGVVSFCPLAMIGAVCPLRFGLTSDSGLLLELTADCPAPC